MNYYGAGDEALKKSIARLSGRGWPLSLRVARGPTQRVLTPTSVRMSLKATRYSENRYRLSRRPISHERLLTAYSSFRPKTAERLHVCLLAESSW